MTVYFYLKSTLLSEGACNSFKKEVRNYLEHTDGAPVDEVADEHSELNWARAALFSVLDPELELEHSLNLSRSINEVLEESVFIIFEEHLPSL